jgi:hypothetical protein
MYIGLIFFLLVGTNTFVLQQCSTRLSLVRHCSKENEAISSANQKDDLDDTLERMIAKSKRDEDLERELLKEEERQKKRIVLKKKSDKEYEAYWERQKAKGAMSKDKSLYSSYYGLKKDQTLDSKLKNLNTGGDKYEQWDYDIKPISSKKYVTGSAGLVGLAATAVLVKKWTTISRFISVNTEFHPLDSRVIRRNYKQNELDRAAVNALRKKSDSGMQELPSLPSQLLTLPAYKGSNPLSVPFSGVTVVVFWRPTDVVSLRTVTAYRRLASLYPMSLRVVAILSPKYPSESDLNKKGGGLLLDEDIPEICLLDDKLEAWRSLGISSWPTTLLIAQQKVVFAMEGDRSLTDVGGRSMAAVASAVGMTSDGNGLASKWDINAPVVTNKGMNAAGGVVLSLSHPTRIATNIRTQRLYISDTGNHRILECEFVQPKTDTLHGSKLVVRRIFGSSNGESGPAPAGVSLENIRFNRPMGVAVDVDGFLYVADSGNDAVRRIDIQDGNSGGNTIRVQTAEVDEDSSGISYDFPELRKIEKALGVSLKEASDLTADELFRLLKVASKDKSLSDLSQVSISQLLGRTRRLLHPTDIGASDAFFYVGCPGSRQIWRIDGGGFVARPVFGSGLNGRRNTRETAAAISYATVGAFLSDGLRFSEPMGITGSVGRVFNVDADGCTLRSINLREGYTRTIAGGGKSISEGDEGVLLTGNGDSDGVGNRAEMCYPTAATNGESVDDLYVADTLNNKIRVVNTRDAKASVRTYIGSSSGQSMKMKRQNITLSSPQGLCYDRSRHLLFISNSGANEMIVVDKKTDEGIIVEMDFSRVK